MPALAVANFGGLKPNPDESRNLQLKVLLTNNLWELYHGFPECFRAYLLRAFKKPCIKFFQFQVLDTIVASSLEDSALKYAPALK